MKPVVDSAKRELKRVIFAEGEDERVLRAAQTLVDEGIASPVLIGRPYVIQTRIQSLGLRLKPEADVEIVHGV
ncbi:phosphate acyltransferase, partial [Acinetobacter baumannii]